MVFRMSTERQEAPSLRREMGATHGAFLVVAAVIGAGIFSVPQRLAAENGSIWVVLAMWAGIGVVCLGAALVWAEIGSRIPEAGCDYIALVQVYGRHTAFVYGWSSALIALPANRAALALVATDYFAVLVPALESLRLPFAAALLLTLGLVNSAPVGRVSMFHTGVAVFKVVGLLLFALAALLIAAPSEDDWLRGAPLDDPAPLAARLAISGLLVFFAFEGWDRVALMAGELRRPQRDLPLAMLLSMSLCIALYLLVNAAYFRLLGHDGVRGSAAVGAEAMESLVGPIGGRLVAALIAVAVIGGLSAAIMGTARRFYAMARTGTFFRFFGRLHPRTGVPARAAMIQSIAGVLMLFQKQSFTSLATSAVFLNLVFYMVRVSTLFGLRRRGIAATSDDHGYRVPWYPTLPFLVLAAFFLLFAVRLWFDWQRAWMDLTLLALGYPAAYLWMRWSEGAAKEDPKGGGA